MRYFPMLCIFLAASLPGWTADKAPDNKAVEDAVDKAVQKAVEKVLDKQKESRAAGRGPGGAGGNARAGGGQKKPAALADKTVAKGDNKKKDKDANTEGEAAKGSTAKGTDEDLDFIEMVKVSEQQPSGDKIFGKIYKELPDSVIMLVHNEEGRIKIPKDKIQAMNFSMGSRLKSLSDDDYAGQYKVGLWAMEKGMYPQAIKLFEFLRDKEDAGPDVLKQLGKAYEERGQLDKAYDNYKEYALGHPDDAEAAAAVKKLEAQVKPKEEEAAVAAVPKVVDGLEADGAWVGETWDNANPATVRFTRDEKTGNKMIVVQSTGGSKDKLAFSRTGQQPLDLSQSADMVFKIFNAGDSPINLACAFVNAQGDFHESKQLRVLPKQWINQSFKVEGKVFKSNRNDFKDWNLELQGRENIGRITFLVYGQKPVTLYMDSLFFK